MFAALLALTAAVAVVDWVAVGTGNRRLEYVCKPLTMVALIAAAVALPDPASTTARWFLVAGLVCSLAGDVFLMLDDLFVPGLASFLVGHLCYIVALAYLGPEPQFVFLGILVVALGVALVGRVIVAGAAEHDPRLRVPVTAYIAAISVMVVLAIGTANPWAVAGALLFYASDACIGWSRFVQPFAASRMAIITTYHLGQVGLVLALTV